MIIALRTFVLLGEAALAAFAAPSPSPLSPTNIFAPVSTPAQSIFELSRLVLMVTAAIFIVVLSLLAYAVKIPNFAAVAEAMGAKGIRIEEPVHRGQGRLWEAGRGYPNLPAALPGGRRDREDGRWTISEARASRESRTHGGIGPE